jgi:hypothetical protein
MDLYERSRHQLLQRLRGVPGPEEAGTLMAHPLPGGYTEVATKSDLLALKHEILADLHRAIRNQTLTFVTITALLNGIMFTALSLSLR